jgi:hypothetical protein
MSDLLRSNRLSKELSQKVVFLIGQSAGGDTPNGLRTISLLNFFQLMSDKSEGLLPRDLFERFIHSEKRGFDPFGVVDKVPAKAALDTEVSIVRTLLRIGENPLDLAFFGPYSEKTATAAVGAGGGGLLELPNLGCVVEAITGDGTDGAGIEALATEFTLNGSVKVRIDGCLNASLGEGEFSHPLNLIADPNTTAAEDTFIGIPLEKRREIIQREGDPLPGVKCFQNSIFIDQSLEKTFSLLFTPRADHGMVEQEELELKPSRFKDLGGLGDDLHPFSGRGKTGWKKL